MHSGTLYSRKKNTVALIDNLCNGYINIKHFKHIFGISLLQFIAINHDTAFGGLPGEKS